VAYQFARDYSGRHHGDLLEAPSAAPTIAADGPEGLDHV